MRIKGMGVQGSILELSLTLKTCTDYLTTVSSRIFFCKVGQILRLSLPAVPICRAVVRLKQELWINPAL